MIVKNYHGSRINYDLEFFSNVSYHINGYDNSHGWIENLEVF